MTRKEYDRAWKEYERTENEIAVRACTFLHFLGTDCEPVALGGLMGTVMRYKLLRADLPKAAEVTP